MHCSELGSASQASHGHSDFAISAGGQVNAQEPCCWRRCRRRAESPAVGGSVAGEESTVEERRRTPHVSHTEAASSVWETCTCPAEEGLTVRLSPPVVVSLYAAARPRDLKTSASTMKPEVLAAGSPSMLRYQTPGISVTSATWSWLLSLKATPSPPK